MEIKFVSLAASLVLLAISACTATGVPATAVVSPVSSAAMSPPAPAELTDIEVSLIDWVDTRSDKILEELRRHVNLNTGTENIEGLNQYRQILAKDLQSLGFNTETVSGRAEDILSCAGGTMEFADHLLARNSAKIGPRILLNGHIDTVFSPGDSFQSLSISDDGTLAGPGVADMKGGIVVLLNALRALNDKNLLGDAQFTVLFNTDEEVGSLSSRPLIEKLAKENDIGLIFEGTRDNKMTYARKGLGQARIKVTGRESHAGGAHEQGVSANLELAQKIVEIEGLTNYEEKTTVNTGVMSGGEKRNTIPGCADAYIDMRYPTAAAGNLLDKNIRAIAEKNTTQNDNYPEFPKSEYWSRLHRPAKEQNDEVDRHIALATALSQKIGEPILGVVYSGGGTDGSIAQAAGLPTLDSLGLNGVGAHSNREASTVTSLIARTKLAAVMIYRISRQ